MSQVIPDQRPQHQVIQQSIYIAAPPGLVEQTIVEPTQMRRWLNPLLGCESVGQWQTQLGGQFRFFLRLPLWQPTLSATVSERRRGVIVWEFSGFFRGQDRWECQPEGTGTRLLNRFEFEIPNPLVAFGFNTFAAPWTRRDMQLQLQRLKRLAEASVVV